MTNKELSIAVNNAIKESGYKKIWIAEKMGISRQALTQMLGKSQFSLDDANRILNTIGMEADAIINKMK